MNIGALMLSFDFNIPAGPVMASQIGILGKRLKYKSVAATRAIGRTEKLTIRNNAINLSMQGTEALTLRRGEPG
jgi:hypothetical protein